MTDKICSKCRASKPLTEYHKDRHKKDGLVSNCKDCIAVANRNWRLENPDLERHHNQNQYLNNRQKLGDYEYRKRKRFYDLKHYYNTSGKWYESKLEQQNYSCVICGVQVGIGNYTTLTVDHDHSCCDKKTKSCGKCLRGLLCNNCQTGLAAFKDKIISLHNAIRYLESYERR